MRYFPSGSMSKNEQNCVILKSNFLKKKIVRGLNPDQLGPSLFYVKLEKIFYNLFYIL